MNTLCDGVVRTVCLGATLVANKDHLAATVLQLLLVLYHVSHIHDAPKRPKVVHRQLPLVPRLERSYAANALHWTLVHHIHSGVHHLALEPFG
jgi:hypothetical protein